MRTTRIYLAGKIARNGWRQSIIDIRNTFHDFETSNDDIANLMVRFNEYTYITGPFFLSCDHGCYHGNGTHGLGVNKGSCCDFETRFTEKEVTDICTEQICNSDVMIAFINDNTCYGTLVEIGLAKAAGIRIVTVFDNKERKRDMWFAASMSDYSMCINDKLSNDLLNMNKFEPHEVDSIEDIIEKIQKWYNS